LTAATLEARRSPRWRSFLELTKPRILPLVIFTGLPALVLSAGEWPPFGFTVAVLGGIALAAAAANTLNMYVERERDGLMERTRNRPLPTAALTPRAALTFGLVLAVIATAELWIVAGPTPAALSVASIAFYVFVYTIWLKPRSVWNAVIGGAAGAAAPLIANAAVTGSVGLPGLILFAIIFFWQPPHVWAIALYRRSDYAAAGIPKMPAVAGDKSTRRQMLAYTAGLVPITLAPALLGWLGPIYWVPAIGLNLWFVAVQVQLMRERTDAAARRVFFVSLAYLFLLYLAMLADLVVRGING
jgi:protoheme IX farnesyltransferase